MSNEIPGPVEAIFKRAVACRICFGQPGLKLKPALIDIAQPRWIGKDYWTSLVRTVLVLLNPSAGNSFHDSANNRFRQHLYAYAAGEATIDAAFAHQQLDIPTWGRGRFTAYYLRGFGLQLSSIALANVAWCAEKDNRYPAAMLGQCFSKHTLPLLKALKPQLVILSGGASHPFKARIAAECDGARVEPVAHYAHRGGNAVTEQEIKRVRAIIAETSAA